MPFPDAPFFHWVVIPALIFLARIVDVSLGTIRIVFVSRGHKIMAMAAGFFEVLVWLLVLGQVMQNLTNPINYIAYAAGFAAGNFAGLTLEERLAMGIVSLQVITQAYADELAERLRKEHVGVTVVGAQGMEGHVRVVYAVIKRKVLDRTIQIIQEMNPKAFICVQDVRAVREGVFPLMPPRRWLGVPIWRKGK